MISAQKVKGSNPFGRTKKVMKTILKTNNHVYLSWVKNLLTTHKIKFYVMDQSMSSVEGNIVAIPVRIMVLHEDVEKAKNILEKEERLLTRKN